LIASGFRIPKWFDIAIDCSVYNPVIGAFLCK
jgi:hypothetical protein